MAAQLPPILRQYDRLAAVAVLAVLLLSLLYLIFAGLQQTQEVQDYAGTVALKQPTKATLKSADLTDARKLLDFTAAPPKTALLTVRTDPDAPNLCTPERRLLCVACAKPIKWETKLCPFCKGQQPAEQKIDIANADSDGDGLPDKWENDHGLNPQDPSDAETDLDQDGFTNIEEFLAKTDPANPKSHPPYVSRMKLAGIDGTKLRLRVVDKMELPSTKDAAGKVVRHYQVVFVQVDEEGSEQTGAIRVEEGELVKNSGFRFVAYHEKPRKQIAVGANKQVRFINVSTIELERVADGKRIETVFKDPVNPDWPGDPLIEQRATIEFDLPDTESVTVAPNGSFTVKGEGFTVTVIDPEKKLVRIKENASGKSFDLQ